MPYFPARNAVRVELGVGEVGHQRGRRGRGAGGGGHFFGSGLGGGGGAGAAAGVRAGPARGHEGPARGAARGGGGGAAAGRPRAAERRGAPRGAVGRGSRGIPLLTWRRVRGVGGSAAGAALGRKLAGGASRAPAATHILVAPPPLPPPNPPPTSPTVACGGALPTVADVSWLGFFCRRTSASCSRSRVGG